MRKSFAQITKQLNVLTTENTITADLSLAGSACNAYGNDVPDLVLEVQYQNSTRLNVKIYPKYLVPANRSLYILDDSLSPSGSISPGSTAGESQLLFEWSNEPSFQFRVKRSTTGESIFDTYGHKIVFEDQFLELVTTMVPDYNIYELPEAIRGSFRLPNQYTQTFWNQYNEMNDQPIDANMHSTHPVYLETRYGNDSSQSHVVYGRNLHGQEWILRPEQLVYRTIGGSIDLYFFSGPTPGEALAQQQIGVIGTPVMQPYWALGFHQVRWGYQNWTVLQSIIDGYADAGIQLEAIWNDPDYLFQYRIFTHDNNTYPIMEGQEFLAKLHANGQYWMLILDPNVYIPNSMNVTDANPTYYRGNELGIYIRRGEGHEDYYIGDQWPGFSVWPDFLLNSTQDFWTNEMLMYHDQLPFDGWWLDISDLSSWCTGSCGATRLSENPVHVPFKLPGEPGQINYDYPEAFEVTNATEAASASTASASQASAYPTPTTTIGTETIGFTSATPGVRNLVFPPYALNLTLAGHSLLKQAVAPYATHNDDYNTTEYELHNTYGYISAKATYAALLAVFPGKRPFFIARSTSPGSGAITGHWGGDSNSRWGNMYMTIAQTLTFSVAGIPYFGVETCGFNGNADMELCTRWMQLSAFFPLYRNHNSRNTISQEAYRWATTAEATHRVMDVRFRLLPYWYTLFHTAHTRGETVLRALSWNFPDEESLKNVDNQFMLGPSILITPVLAPLLRASQGVFPGVPTTRWYDWYTLEEVQAQPGQNVTLDAPLEHIPVHVRGGSIIASQVPGNTTNTTRSNPWSVLAALDADQRAEGELYLDDGVSLEPEDHREVQVS
jgi:alpha-glucosidase